MHGWLSRVDMQIIHDVMAHQQQQGWRGGVVEIGVHMGRSFIPITLFANGDPKYAIDIFGDQHLNPERSGWGDLDKFKANLGKFAIDPEDVTIDVNLSSAVEAGAITEAVGAVRLFHIDGGHDYDAISTDMTLAMETLSETGVIVVDDTFRGEWPDVTAGMFDALSASPDFRIFAIGFNKSYICRSHSAEDYREALQSNPFLKMYYQRDYKSRFGDALVYQTAFNDNWGWRRFALEFLKFRRPHFAERLLGR